MASFSFNFNVTEEDRDDTSGVKGRTLEDSSFQNKKNCSSKSSLCVEVFASTLKENLKTDSYQVYKYGNKQEIKYFDSKFVEEKLQSSAASDSDGSCEGSIKSAICNQSDLIPNVYEGGLKVWECSYDLVSYLCEEEVSFKDLRVLELGCGAGLPGIFALKAGARHVIFQDFNVEVIENMTIPTVLLNSAYQVNRCRFIGGDWGSVAEDDVGFKSIDVILTSETIYNTESVPKLYNLMRRVLTSDGVINSDIYGNSSERYLAVLSTLVSQRSHLPSNKLKSLLEDYIGWKKQSPAVFTSYYTLMPHKNDENCYVAAKTHYFGVGGGTRLFEEFVKQRNEFDICTCRLIEEGLQREILKLTRKGNDGSDDGIK